MKSFYRNSISLFFLTSFLLLRVVNVHAVYHDFTDSDAQHCELCAIVAHNNHDTPLEINISDSDFFIGDFMGFGTRDNFALYIVPNRAILHSDYFYNKPPPATFFG